MPGTLSLLGPADPLCFTERCSPNLPPSRPAAMSFWTECGTFLRESRRHFRDTGALLPSSRFLARALAAPLAGQRPPCRILQVGPGTGSVTRAILRRLQPGDQLDCVELNDHFVERLE